MQEVDEEIIKCVILDLKYSKAWEYLEMFYIDHFCYIKGKFTEDVGL